MKTTLDLPDDLLIEAKSMAARRRTTLKAIVEHALRREIQGKNEEISKAEERYDRNELGFLVLRRNASSPKLRIEELYNLEASIDASEMQEALKSSGRIP